MTEKEGKHEWEQQQQVQQQQVQQTQQEKEEKVKETEQSEGGNSDASLRSDTSRSGDDSDDNDDNDDKDDDEDECEYHDNEQHKKDRADEKGRTCAPVTKKKGIRSNESNSNNSNNSSNRHTKSEKTSSATWSETAAPFHKIVLTGGPCGGKTTALARLSSYLRERGFDVMTSPEAFSLLVANGFSLEHLDADGMDVAVQGSVFDLQTALEDGFERLLKARGKPSVLLCDRGLMDGAAYVSPSAWTSVLQARNVRSECDVREGRYNAVFHLVTAAEGAERYYTLDNNEARTEPPELARRLDRSTRLAWVGHPRLCVLDNSTDFEEKLRRLVDATARLVGLPSRLSRVTTKFLLSKRPNVNHFPDDVQYHVFQVEKVYLYGDDAKTNNNAKTITSTSTDTTNTSNNNQPTPNTTTSNHSYSSSSYTTPNYDVEYSFVRKRTHISPIDGRQLGSVYGQTTVRRENANHLNGGGQVIELKRILSRREYVALYRTRDTNRHVVRQHRVSFLYKTQSFNIHMYDAPVADLCILHAQVEAKKKSVEIGGGGRGSSSGGGGGGEDGMNHGKKDDSDKNNHDCDYCDTDNQQQVEDEEGEEEEPDVSLPPFLDIKRRLENTRQDEEMYGAFHISLKKKN